jgi:transposase-like protein
MCLDASKVLKRSVLCPRCKQDYLFTLRAIADRPQLKCPGCGSHICVNDDVHAPLLREVRNALDAIDWAQLAPSFMNRRMLT